MEFTNNILDYYWSFEDLIGQSNLCRVYKCYLMSETDPAKRGYAIKIISLQNVSENPDIMHEIETEKEILQMLKGDNVIYGK